VLAAECTKRHDIPELSRGTSGQRMLGDDPLHLAAASLELDGYARGHGLSFAPTVAFATTFWLQDSSVSDAAPAAARLQERVRASR
jgi:hypothetical protein